jgi:hypothetical protein
LDDLNEAEVDEAAGATVRHELGELERGGVLEEGGLEKSERLLLDRVHGSKLRRVFGAGLGAKSRGERSSLGALLG